MQYLPYIYIGIGALLLGLFCYLRDKKSSIIAICVKTLVSIMFILTGVFALLNNQNPLESIKLPAIYMIIGLVLGLIGDIVLDLKIYLKGLDYERAQKDSDTLTYFGMVAFGVGHIFYIFSVFNRYLEAPLIILWSFLIAIGVAALIFTIAIGVMKMRFGKFLMPSVVYCILLSWFIVYCIWRCATQTGEVENIILVVGSIMFIVSDLILSMTYFSKPEDYEKKGIMNPESKFLISANHITYYIAQFLIAIAIMFI